MKVVRVGRVTGKKGLSRNRNYEDVTEGKCV